MGAPFCRTLKYILRESIQIFRAFCPALTAGFIIPGKWRFTMGTEPAFFFIPGMFPDAAFFQTEQIINDFKMMGHAHGGKIVETFTGEIRTLGRAPGFAWSVPDAYSHLTFPAPYGVAPLDEASIAFEVVRGEFTSPGVKSPH
jgi:hypothetical protein